MSDIPSRVPSDTQASPHPGEIRAPIFPHPRGDQLAHIPSPMKIIGAAVAGRHIPGVVAAVGRGPVTLATRVAGQADSTPGRARAMTAGTVFDLASLTKVVATTTATLALASRQRLGLGDPVTHYLPAFAWSASQTGPVTLWHLLTHTAGLPDTRKFYEWCGTREDLLHDLAATPLAAPPGTQVSYSDLGFIALGEIVAEVAGQPLDQAIRRLVTEPLGMIGTGYNPAGPPDRFAATERRADGTCWTGIVHDENARLMGGVAGHAGLFSTVADMTRFAGWWVSAADGPVPAGLRRAAESGQTAGLGGCRGLGWVCAGDRFDILGSHWPASAVSHTGFTGTSLALDSPSGAWVILLTNAVHAGRDNTAIMAFRRDVHSAVAADLFGDGPVT
jgi:CubicO group peptidase (beta-lactamase class C family)